jgi:hypothetical protein
MPFEDDAVTVTATIIDALGGTVVHRSAAGTESEIAAIFRREWVESDVGGSMQSSLQTWIEAKEADASGMRIGDLIVRSDGEYVIVDFQRDADGEVDVILEHDREVYP